MDKELYHYGILGMKWGVRRYQNKDGSYTRKGLERYRKSEAEYNSAREKYKSAKSKYKSGNGSKQDVEIAKSNLRIAKRGLDKSYDKLKNDYLGDQGKELYRKGKTIKGNEARTIGIVGGSNFAAVAANKLLQNTGKYISTKYGNIPLDKLVPGVISVGGTATAGILKVKDMYEAKRLRAYYAH
ncbi:MAG: hypothetical protein IJ192_10365 [Clostridia bacterium]|nr:hypothetical protein [Clostridia bacterium]